MPRSSVPPLFADPGEARTRLEELLQEFFVSEIIEIRRFTRLHYGIKIASTLPSGDSTVATLVTELLDSLLRRGLLDDAFFLNLLRHATPGLSGSIRHFAAVHDITLPERRLAAPGRPTLRGRRAALLAAIACFLLLNGGDRVAVETSSSASARILATMLAGAPRGCPIGMDGIPGGELRAKDGRVVVITPFCLDRFEVTMDDYAGCVNSRGCIALAETVTKDAAYSRLCNKAGDPSRRRHPVNCVAWSSASAYCEKRGAGNRLPNQDEFEWAMRGGDLAREYPWPLSLNGVHYDGGENPLPHLLNACGPECKRGFADLWKVEWDVMYVEDDGWPQTAEVGSFPASPLGPHDLAGNIMEWTASKERNKFVLKGGAWFHSDPKNVHATGRSLYPPGDRLYYAGFRCARDLLPAASPA